MDTSRSFSTQKVASALLNFETRFAPTNNTFDFQRHHARWCHLEPIAKQDDIAFTFYAKRLDL
jgi:hypothetical protein